MSTDGLRQAEEYSAKGATHPRVSLAHMEGKIRETYYVNAGEAVPLYSKSALHLLTRCFLVMENGFVVVGKSAPASAENFNVEKGQAFAYEDAIRQLWPLEGYLLRSKLAEG